MPTFWICISAAASQVALSFFCIALNAPRPAALAMCVGAVAAYIAFRSRLLPA